jgi:enoyl-CoA hydratase/carnithine racemase
LIKNEFQNRSDQKLHNIKGVFFSDRLLQDFKPGVEDNYEEVKKMSDEVILTRSNGIVRLTLNRPDEKNMLSDEAIRLLNAHVLEVSRDGSVRVVVLTGDGHEFFCGGVFNPLQMSSLSVEQIRNRRQQANELFDRLEKLTHPVIAAINGRAQAGGLEMALACDMRVTVSHATFALPETSWGMFPGAGGPIRLPRIVGMGKAMEIIMTAWDFTADEALRIGLVERVIQEERIDLEVNRLAEAIAATGPLGNRAVKKLIRSSMDTSMEAARAYSDALREPLASSADTAEGIAAYRENRSPVFQGK